MSDELESRRLKVHEEEACVTFMFRGLVTITLSITSFGC